MYWFQEKRGLNETLTCGHLNTLKSKQQRLPQPTSHSQLMLFFPMRGSFVISYDKIPLVD